MDKITIDRIRFAHPKIREQLLEDYLYVNNKILGRGVRLRFSWVYRSPEQQNKLFKKRPKVTNAKAGQSIHNYGLAFDIVLLYDNDSNGTFEQASWNRLRDGDKDGRSDWLEVTQEFEKRGWKNGFISRGKKWDFPHFQKDFGLKWFQMKRKIDNGDYFIEIIDGKKYKWINI